MNLVRQTTQVKMATKQKSDFMEKPAPRAGFLCQGNTVTLFYLTTVMINGYVLLLKNVKY